MSEHITQLLTRHSVDVIYVDQIAMTQYLPTHPSAKVVVDLCDCISLLFDQRVKAETRLRQRLALWIEAVRIRAFETRVVRRFDRTIFISTADVRALYLREDDPRVSIIELGIDCDYFSPATEITNHPKNLIFVGAMDYLPNNDAALFFVREVFPLLTERDKDFKIFIVGSNPSSELRQLHNGNNIIITGTVEDVRPYLRNASVFVSPLRLGVGVKHKIFIAMSMGVPIVATTVSINGTDLKDRKHLLVADTKERIVDAICEIVHNKQLANSLQQASFDVVRQHYNYSVGAEKLDRLLNSL